eukprot:gene7052-147_t
MPQITVGFLGLGIMGTAMARNLLKKKGELFSDVIIWNRTASKMYRSHVLPFAPGLWYVPRGVINAAPLVTTQYDTDRSHEARMLLPSPSFHVSGLERLRNAIWICTAELEVEGCKVAATPSELIQRCDITFGMLSDPDVALSVVFGEGGVLEGAAAGKSYVDMSTVDEQTSIKIGEALTAKGMRFLEAPVSGSKGPAIAGQLVILCAGDRSLYDECTGAFDLMGKKALFLGEVGAGARMKLVVNMVMGSMMGAFTEGMALADKGGLQQQDLLDVLSLGAIANPMFSMKGPTMIERSYAPAFPLKHQQKDMRLAIALGDQLGQSLPIAAAANELYKVARTEHGDKDFSAVYEATAPKK